MTIEGLYLLGPAATLVVSITVLAYLRRPLRGLLVDLCGSEPRASFWTAFSVVTLLLTPEIFALGAWPEEGSTVDAIVALSQQLKWALLGLVISVIVLGVVLGSFISRTRPAPIPIVQVPAR
jgi:hypothetical protein